MSDTLSVALTDPLVVAILRLVVSGDIDPNKADRWLSGTLAADEREMLRERIVRSMLVDGATRHMDDGA